MDPHEPEPVDLFVIGGGINGCGIARDAAGRGLTVRLAEAGDLAQATSSASTKLIHGGLRYLEYLELRLVREALHERELLLAAMPHISWPLRFVLPVPAGMRVESDTPVAHLLGRALPWLRGRRPAWLIRLGLGLYDHLGGRRHLPGTRVLDLTCDPAGRALRPGLRRAYEYSDGWVQDARLVVLNARDAAARGADIRTRTRVTAARREDGLWRIETESGGRTETHRARALVNAAGPWAASILGPVIATPARGMLRLVRGSHIVTRRLWDHDRCYVFQGPDGRIVFAVPFEQDFTLIGTTDVDHDGDPAAAVCTGAETAYLCAFVSRYLARPVTPADVVWTCSGVRALHDDSAGSPSAASRDYRLALDAAGAPLLNVFGGKITTYRRLAEAAMARLAPFFPQAGPDWTAGVALPGGDFPAGGVAEVVAGLRGAHPWLGEAEALRLVRTYGTEAAAMLAGGPGESLGGGLTEAELDWLMRREWARSAEDVVWRRTKLGLRMSAAEIAALEARMARRLAEAAATVADGRSALPSGRPGC